MNGHISHEKIEEIKSSTDIVDLVSEYVALKKTGKNYVGHCPFHTEKTPSFTVNPEKQIYYCFGCGEGGNVFSFVMKVTNVSFPEAVRYLASKKGIFIPSPERGGKANEGTGEQEKIYRINQLASEFFSRMLSSEAAFSAKQYLQKRGLDVDIIKEFRLGYAPPGWRHLKDFFEKKRIPVNLAVKAGLLIFREEGKIYDRFRDRLIFPIENVTGKVIAFGGRVLAEGEPKYLNSPESPVYTKGRNVYGLYRAKDIIRKRNEVILVEGYMDLISLWGAGITNVVASLGTALTKNQTGLLKRFTSNIVVLFDSDAGGRSAVERSMGLFLEENMNARVGILPAGYDPDDYVRTFGKESLEKVIIDAPPMIDYYIDTTVTDSDSMVDAVQTAGKVISFISNISDRIQRNLFIKRVSEKMGIEQKVLKEEISKKIRKNVLPKEKYMPVEEQVGIDKVEMHLIYMMLAFPEKILDVKQSNVLTYMTNEDLKTFCQKLINAYDNTSERDIISSMINELQNHKARSRIMQLMVSDRLFDTRMIDRVLRDTIKQIRDKWYKNQHKNIQRELLKAQKTGDAGLCTKLLIEKARLLSEERELP